MDNKTELLEMTADIAAAFVGNNSVAPGDLPALIQTIHASLKGIESGAVEPEATIKATAAQIRKSIRPDALISFEDGKAYKSIKRHLSTRGLTVADYRAKWGLPDNYPTVAPEYSAARSALAKAAGLGQGGRGGTARSKAKAAPKTAPNPRGRPKKS